MLKIKRIVSFLLVALFASYYVSTTFFIHTHIDESGKLFAHSHPYSSESHTHSTSALLLINNLTYLLFVIGGGIVVCMALLSVLQRLFFSSHEGYTLSPLVGGNLQRGPPMLI